MTTTEQQTVRALCVAAREAYMNLNRFEYPNHRTDLLKSIKDAEALLVDKPAEAQGDEGIEPYNSTEGAEYD